MDPSIPSSTPIKSALFVDFDNIYIGLSKTDPDAAERFASDPARWLAWLEKGLPNRSGNKVAGPRSRSILIRRCYPNPDAGFRRFRSYFTSAAFSVIDCPTLTRTGKNSSDIYMVMDILDTLNHKTYFDEFIIFSGDSDFMPVLLRLRAHDRRTTTLAIDFMPPAFKAACDLVISEEEFIEEALGLTHDTSCGGANNGRSRVPVQVLKEMAMRVYEVTCEGGEVAGADLPDILKDFREFRDSSNWLGFGTSQRLAEALACSEPRLNLVRLSPMTYKIVLKPGPTRPEVLGVEVSPSSPAVLTKPEVPAARLGALSEDRPSEPAGSNGDARSPKADLSRMRNQIIDMVREMVAGSRSALLLARVSQYVVSKLGPQVLETQWAGAGSFKRLLQSTHDLGLEITTQPEPGYIFDPKRHMPPTVSRSRGTAEVHAPGSTEPSTDTESLTAGSEPVEMPGNGRSSLGYSSKEDYAAGSAGSFGLDRASDPFVDEGAMDSDEDEEDADETYRESLPSLEEFVLRVSRVTGAPDLTQEQYAIVFHGIIWELKAIARGEKSYNTYQSSKAVSDWCAERGTQVSRGDIVLIFKGIIYQDGVRFGKRPDSYTEYELASVVRDNIKALCRRSRLELSEYEHRLLDEWILGGLEELESVQDEDPSEPDQVD